jgi:NhaP-type Na+/H+ or K+/H+ antiporter
MQDILTMTGAALFGVVMGWVTYRTLRRSAVSGLSDIATVIGAVGGAAVTKLFPTETGVFGAYCIGLAFGFFAYLVTAMILASRTGKLSAVNEWLGENPAGGGGWLGDKPKGSSGG